MTSALPARLAILLATATAVPVAAQTASIEIGAISGLPGGNTQIEAQFFHHGEPIDFLYGAAVGAYDKFGHGWAFSLAVRADTSIGVNPALASATFGFVPPTGATGWPTGTDWMDGFSSMGAFAAYEEVVTSNARAAAFLNILFDRSLGITPHFADWDANWAAAETVKGMPLPSGRRLVLDSIYALSEIGLEIYDSVANVVRRKMTAAMASRAVFPWSFPVAMTERVAA